MRVDPFVFNVFLLLLLLFFFFFFFKKIIEPREKIRVSVKGFNLVKKRVDPFKNQG